MCVLWVGGKTKGAGGEGGVEDLGEMMGGCEGWGGGGGGRREGWGGAGALGGI